MLGSAFPTKMTAAPGAGATSRSAPQGYGAGAGSRLTPARPERSTIPYHRLCGTLGAFFSSFPLSRLLAADGRVAPQPDGRHAQNCASYQTDCEESVFDPTCVQRPCYTCRPAQSNQGDAKENTIRETRPWPHAKSCLRRRNLAARVGTVATSKQTPKTPPPHPQKPPIPLATKGPSLPNQPIAACVHPASQTPQEVRTMNMKGQSEVFYNRAITNSPTGQ